MPQPPRCASIHVIDAVVPPSPLPGSCDVLVHACFCGESGVAYMLEKLQLCFDDLHDIFYTRASDIFCDVWENSTKPPAERLELAGRAFMTSIVQSLRDELAMYYHENIALLAGEFMSSGWSLEHSSLTDTSRQSAWELIGHENSTASYSCLQNAPRGVPARSSVPG